MVLFWAIAVAVMFQGCDSQADPNNFDFMYKCRLLPNGIWEMKAIVNTYGNPITEIFGVYPADNAKIGDTCSTNPVTQNNPYQEILKSRDSYTIRIKINSVANQVIELWDCGVLQYPNGGLRQGQFQWKFQVVTDYPHPSLTLAYEKIYSIFCDFNDPTFTEMGYVSAGVNITRDPVPTVGTYNKPSVIKVVHAESLTILTALAPSDSMRLKAELVTENLPPGTPQYIGVSPFSCKACTNPCNSTSAPLIFLSDTNGQRFGVASNTVIRLMINKYMSHCLYTDTPTLGDEPFTNQLSGSANGAVLFTGPFFPFLFSFSLSVQVSDLVFDCEVEYCLPNTDVRKCTNRCDYLTNVVRKRRDVSRTETTESSPADNTTLKNDDYISVLVKIVKNLVRVDANPVTGELPMNKTYRNEQIRQYDPYRCDGFQGFLIGVCILGATLVVAMALCLCLCLKIFSNRRKAQSNEINGKKKQPSH